ncbi:MAG: hypothetical protein R3C18_11125 [Planctomycetaceae bacterium]
MDHYDQIAYRIAGEVYEVGLVGPPGQVDGDILLSKIEGEKSATEFMSRLSDFTGLSTVQVERPILEGTISDETAQAVDNLVEQFTQGAKIAFVCGALAVMAWLLWMFGGNACVLVTIALFLGGATYLFRRYVS